MVVTHDVFDTCILNDENRLIRFLYYLKLSCNVNEIRCNLVVVITSSLSESFIS